MKSFLKGFLNTMLWLISISALCISLFVISKVEISKDTEDVLKFRERILALENENLMLEEKVNQLQHGVYNHIHKQYSLIPFYQGKGTEYQLENSTVLVFLNDRSGTNKN